MTGSNPTATKTGQAWYALRFRTRTSQSEDHCISLLAASPRFDAMELQPVLRLICCWSVGRHDEISEMARMVTTALRRGHGIQVSWFGLILTSVYIPKRFNTVLIFSYFPDWLPHGRPQRTLRSLPRTPQ